MTFLATIALFAGLALCGAWIGDPTFRPEHDPGHWHTTVEKDAPDEQT